MNFINTYNKQTDYLAGTMCSERALQFMMEQCNMTMDDVQEAMTVSYTHLVFLLFYEFFLRCSLFILSYVIIT